MKRVMSVMVSLILLLSLMPAAVFADSDCLKVEFGKEYKLSDVKGGVYDDDFCFKITPPEKGRIRVWVKNMSESGDVYSEYYINRYDFKREWIKKGDNANSGWISVDKGETTISFNGGYDPYNINGINEPIIYVEYQKSADYNGELEFNGSFECSTPIKSGITYYGDYSMKDGSGYYSSEEYDNDYYSFKIDTFALVKMNLKCEQGYYDPDFTLYLNDENGNKKQVLSDSECIYNDDELGISVSFRLPKGQYYILVNPRKFSAEYSLNVDYSTSEGNGYYEKEFNDSSSVANYIEIDQQYTGNFNSKKDNDWFQFVLNEKRDVALEFRIPEQVGDGAVKVTLYDEEFNVIKEIATDNNAYYSMDKVTKPAGIYYVKVAPGYSCLNSNSNYSFKINTDVILNPVTDLKVTYDKYNKLKVTWEATDGAKGYNIYSKKGKSKVLIKRGYTEDCEFLAENLADGAKYTFVVEPCASKDNELIPAEYARKEVSAYTLAKVIQNKPGKYNSSKVKITWNKVYGADGYEVQKLIKKNSKYIVMNSFRTSKTSINIKAKKKTKYYYKVRAYKRVNGDRIYAPWSSQKSYKL